MKKDLHPSNYREVVFKDMSNDEIFITRSTVAARETILYAVYEEVATWRLLVSYRHGEAV